MVWILLVLGAVVLAISLTIGRTLLPHASTRADATRADTEFTGGSDKQAHSLLPNPSTQLSKTIDPKERESLRPLPPVWSNLPDTSIDTWYVVIHRRADHPTIEEAVRKTWTTKLGPNERFDFIVGSDGTDIVHDADQNYLTLPVTEIFEHILHKTVLAWQYMLAVNKSWKWTVRTNNGTYFQPHLLQNLSETNFFGGHMTFSKFIGGWFMVFSRDVIERLVEYALQNWDALPNQDDVGIASIVTNVLGLPMVDMPGVFWVHEEPVETLPKSGPAYRLSLPLGPEKTGRVPRFYALHEHF